MPRVLLLVLAALAVPVASGQPAARDSVARLPAFSVPVTGDYAPPQTSAALAYALSTAATVGPIVAGLALDGALGPSPETGTNRPAVITLVLVGAWFGPQVGNLSLGAGADVRQGFAVTAGGFLTGVVLVGGAVVIGGVCLVGDLVQGEIGSDTCGAGPLAGGLLVAGTVVAVVGTVAGAAYGLATIPGNAAAARRYRQRYPRVAVAPGWRGGRPALSVRVGL